MDPGENQVDIVVPQDVLSNDIELNKWERGGVAGLLNYNAQTSGSAGGGSSVLFNQLSTEAGFNAGQWIARTKQIFTRFDGNSNIDFQSAYAQRTLGSIKKVFQVGQIDLVSNLFSTGPLLGAQLFPEPALHESRSGTGDVSGIADTQSVVQVRQSGALIYSTTVPAGPFHLSDLPLLNTRSDLQITQTDTSGSIKTWIVPASSLLIQGGQEVPGLSIGFGRLDQDGGDLSPLLGTVSTGWQFKSGSIVSAGLLGSDTYRAVSASLDTQPLPATLVTLQGTGSQDIQHGNEGLSGNVTFSWHPVDRLSFNVNYSQQSIGYRELSDAVQYDKTNVSGLSSRQLGAGVSWSQDEFGALSLSWSHNTPFSRSPYAYYSAAWNKRVGLATLAISWQHNAAVSNADYRGNTTTTASEDLLYVSLNIPFGKQTLSSYVSNSSRNGARSGLSYRRQYDGSGWGLSGDRDFSGNYTSITGSGDITNHLSQLSGSLTRAGEITSWFGSSSGGVLIHKSGITASPYSIGDTFGIAKVGNESNVKINTPSGPVWTDSRGYAVIPSLGAYKQSNVEVDTRSLKKSTDISNAWQETNPARGTVSQLEFGVVSTRRVLTKISDSRGRSLPYGASVFDADGNFITITGNQGEVFIDNAQPGAAFDVYQRGSLLCSFQLELSKNPIATQPVLFETVSTTCR